MNKDLLDYYTKRIAEEMKEDGDISEGVLRELLKDYVKNTDYATGNDAGVVKIGNNYGIGCNSEGRIYVQKATKEHIDAKTENYRPIVPANLEYAVKSVGDGYYATEEQVGEISAALDSVIASQESILAMQNALIGGDA